MANRLAGKVALVTGGTSGIGEATVRLFASEGANVVLVGRSAAQGQQIAHQLDGRAVFVRADVSDEAGVVQSIDAAVATFGRLDILFSNAGAPSTGTIETLTPADFTASMNLLVGSVLFGIKHAAPIMRAQGWGRIINTTSVAGLRGHMGDYLYSIAKAAVGHATRLAAVELARSGITVNSIAPGAVATPIFFGGSAAANALDPAHAAAKIAKLTANLAKATPRLVAGLPEDVAAAALFLAGDEAAHVNGHDLVVDGGMIAGGRVNYE